MALDYLKIFPDVEVAISAYNEDQKGRLLLAMMRYAFHGEEPEFYGEERFAWPGLRQKIDICESKVEKLKANGSKGGRPRKPEASENQREATETKENQEKAKESKQKPAKANESPNEYEHDHEYVQENEHEQEKEQEKRACAREDGCGGVIALDDSDLTQDIERNAEAERLIKRYGLPDTEATLCALLDDFAAHGQDKVRQALDQATLSDKRRGISVNYYRAVLANLGKPRAAPAQPAAQETTNKFLRIAMQMREEGGGT